MDVVLAIKAKLSAGRLPCEVALRIFAGNGSGQRCAARDEVIPKSSVEHGWSSADGRILRRHARCAALVDGECLRAATA